MTSRGHKHRLRKFVEKWDIPWYVFTVILFGAALGALIFVFPDVSNTWVSIFVLVGSFTTSVGTLITAVKSQRKEEEQK